MGIPLQRDADMGDPRQHVLWALVGMGDAPLLMPLPIMAEWSEHIFNAGFRHHPELQTVYYSPPGEDASFYSSMSGEWIKSESPGVPPDEVNDDEIDRLIAGLDERMKAVLREKLGDG